MSRLPAATLALLATLSLICTSAPPAGAAADDESVPLQVTPNLLERDATAGERVDVTVTVQNKTDKPVSARVARVGTTTANNGGLGYLSEPGDGASSWMQLDQDSLQLAPGATGDITGSIDIPDDAPKGVSIAAIAVWVPADDAGAGDESADLGATMDFQIRQIIPVVLTVPGGAPADLGVTSVVVSEGAEPRLGLTVANEGDVHSGGTGEITIPSLDVAAPFSFGTILPGGSTTLAVPWTGDLPAGTHAVDVKITDAAGRVSSWSGELTVTSDVADPSADASEPAGEVAAPAPASDGLSPVLLVGLALGAAVAGGVVVTVAQRASRARRPIGKHSTDTTS